MARPYLLVVLRVKLSKEVDCIIVARVTLRALRARDQELARLVDAIRRARQGAPHLAIVSGPRRVGKSFLVHHALAADHGCTPVYFEATQAGEAAQLRRFHDTLRAAVGPDALPPGPAPQTWEQAIDLAAYAAQRRPLAVVIDEATYLMASTPGFASMVQVVWDRMSTQSHPPELALILTGSALGLIEESLSHRGALFQRPTVRLALRPFTPSAAWRFRDMPDPVALLEAYAACGGYPLHLDAWDFERSTQDNLLALAGTAGGVLLEDGSHLLAGLVDAHQRVLIAVGEGRGRPSEITNEVGARIERPLDALTGAGLVSAATPIGAPRQARPTYRVDDAYLRFWFRLLGSHEQQIEAGQGEAVLHQGREAWQEQLGWSFEQAARLHAIRLAASGVLPEGTLVGEWWTTRGQPAQVDVLGLSSHRTVAVGEARWQERPLGSRAVDELAAKLRLVPSPVAQPLLMLWGRGGVRPDTLVGAVRGYGPADIVGG